MIKLNYDIRFLASKSGCTTGRTDRSWHTYRILSGSWSSLSKSYECYFSCDSRGGLTGGKSHSSRWPL